MSKVDLTAAMKAATATTKQVKPTKPAVVKAKHSAAPKTEERQTSREGKKPLIAYFDPAAVRELKILAADQDKTQQELITEAINDLLAKHGRKPIA